MIYVAEITRSTDGIIIQLYPLSTITNWQAHSFVCIYARSNEAQRDFRRSAPSNEYISINVSRVSFESSASRNMKCHLLEHIARHTHDIRTYTHTHTRLDTIENGLDRDRVETLLLYEDIITKNTLLYIAFNCIS
ncbi:hypothetical protein ALC56_10614 [Trachymyrmex septentrionalis]|uniref:Uncharacterized protein n=1 Tax=Trachymyrmex septentrionalis TaxID=34720 RepID=A0A195F4B5_9HYME|nr:hypothetical protein ALC56_10614 [Trachymyrmex septentrionalis]